MIDVEGKELISSHDDRDDYAAEVTGDQVTVVRDDDGKFLGMIPIGTSPVRMNYMTPSQDVINGTWAVVEPFSVAGARTVLEAPQYPAMSTPWPLAVLDIAPVATPLPAEVTMMRPKRINSYKAEDVRIAFHLIQSTARANVTQAGGGEAQALPCITIIVTPYELE